MPNTLTRAERIVMAAAPGISPDIRRHIIRYAARENLDYVTALECLVMQGIVAEGVDKPVDNMGTDR